MVQLGQSPTCCTMKAMHHQIYQLQCLWTLIIYAGPPLFHDHPKCVPIPPLSAERNSGGKHLSRQQLHLQIRYAITIHKSQGQTLDKAVIDIGSAELVAGCTFVAVSRLQKLQDGLFQPMPLQRLLHIWNGKCLAEKIKEEERLQKLPYSL